MYNIIILNTHFQIRFHILYLSIYSLHYYLIYSKISFTIFHTKDARDGKKLNISYTLITWYTKYKLTFNISINKWISLSNNISYAKMEICSGWKLIIVTFINFKTQWGYDFKYSHSKIFSSSRVRGIRFVYQNDFAIIH